MDPASDYAPAALYSSCRLGENGNCMVQKKHTRLQELLRKNSPNILTKKATYASCPKLVIYLLVTCIDKLVIINCFGI